MSEFNLGDKVYAEVVIIEKDTGVYEINIGGNTENPYVHFVIPEKYLHKIPEKTYEDGLNEAWELAYKIVGLQKNGAMSIQDTLEIFGTEYAGDKDEILHDFTFQEAAEKIEKWENANEIHAGDVVISSNKFKGVVSRLCGDIAYAIWDDGSCGSYSKDDFIKTGRTIDIESLLKQIGGAE